LVNRSDWLPTPVTTAAGRELTRVTFLGPFISLSLLPDDGDVSHFSTISLSFYMSYGLERPVPWSDPCLGATRALERPYVKPGCVALQVASRACTLE
uniref:Uncharacterized protein n=1 Tax=Plectus sambesii TaxID=2011161 RepID=A0A914VPM0_9BILA